MIISQVTGPCTSSLVSVEDPVPGDHEVLVRVVASGLCTSDLPAWRRGPGSGAPVRLGHEIVGTVVAAGQHGRGWVPGDLVTGLGGSGFASLAVMDAARVLPVPSGIDPALALGEPVADLYEALSRTPMAPGERVAVVGLGFMGLGLIQLVRDRAPGLLIGVDPLPAARQRALDLGADLVFAPGAIPAEYRDPAPDAGGAAADGADGADADRPADLRADVVLEATGVTAGLATAGTLVRPYGTLCVVGYHHAGDARMDMDLWYKAVTVVNGFCPDQNRLIRAMSDALDLIARHRFSYAPLVTHRFRLDQVDESFTLMASHPADFVKAVLLP